MPITSELGISLFSIHSILHYYLKMNIVFVCTCLSTAQKDIRVNMSRDLIDMADEDDSFLKKIAKDDETWCFLNNPQIKLQSSE
ncbi:uncharacterized protein TNCV_2674271 [Trichonephila clavipes]|nr:uncharacterized protein TNCV_2674271 [Trichonephila clavipes]